MEVISILTPVLFIVEIAEKAERIPTFSGMAKATDVPRRGRTQNVNLFHAQLYAVDYLDFFLSALGPRRRPRSRCLKSLLSS